MDCPLFFYSTAGALMVDREIDGLTQEISGETADFYGGRYFVCETITRNAAKRIAEALGGKWKETE